MYSVWFLNDGVSVVGFSSETISELKNRADYYHQYYTEIYPDTEKNIEVTKLCNICEGNGSRQNKVNKFRRVICKACNGTGEVAIDEIEYLELLAISDSYGVIIKEGA